MMLVHWTECTLYQKHWYQKGTSDVIRDTALLLINNKKIGHLFKVKLASTLAQNQLYDEFMWCYFMACSGEAEVNKCNKEKRNLHIYMSVQR